MLLYSIAATAQEEQKHYVNHHLFELSIGTGTSVAGYAIDKKTENLTPLWTIRNTSVSSIGLSFYITKHISVGITGNVYKWNTKYSETYKPNIDNSHIVGPIITSNAPPRIWDGNNRGFSGCIVGNYDLPVRSSIFYGGVAAGVLKGFENASDKGVLGKAEGVECNAHIGYKLTLVKKRFWFYLEAASILDFSKQVGIWGVAGTKYFSIDNYSFSGGLKFRI